LGEHQCYVRLSSGGQRLPTFSVSLDPPLGGNPAFGAALTQASAERYGRAAALVEADRRSALARLREARAARAAPAAEQAAKPPGQPGRPEQPGQPGQPEQSGQPRRPEQPGQPGRTNARNQHRIRRKTRQAEVSPAS
jgi:hypothetical protein